ncbi:hypothetical protein ON010_g16722 [Phytophthora cinnamomi]|nr:hypothetical protein ON010_g16722 [Phytophthora cinnamomi]
MATLWNWQQLLFDSGLVNATTPEDSAVEMESSLDSVWSPPQHGKKADHPPNPPEPQHSSIPAKSKGRFAPSRATTAASKRG